MATMNVSLPDPMKKWAENQAVKDTYSNASDYVRDLIRRDQRRSAKIVAFQKLLDGGRSSDISTRSMDDIWSEALSRANG